jgi:hypothetical protein
LACRAQAVTRTRHVGAFLYLKEKDSEAQTYAAAFEKELAALGWVVGGNLQIDYRWTGGDPKLVRQYAEELVAASPDVILVAGGSHVGPIQKLTRTLPIVFVQVADAVGGGFVESMGRPAAMPPVLPILNLTLPVSGLSCSSKCRRVLGGSRFFVMPPIPVVPHYTPPSWPWHGLRA